MGYFSNGSEGEGYVEQYCSRCANFRNGEGETECAVWFAHLLHNYGAEGPAREILDMLIPRAEGGVGNQQCAMFREGGERPPPRLPMKGTLFEHEEAS